MGDLKPLVFLASSKKDLLALPAAVIQRFGFALYLAQCGKKHDTASVLRGFGSAGVLEIVEDLRGNAYRCMYTVKVAGVVYVLHVFQKKSKSGIATPQHEMDLIRERLKLALSRRKEP
ncbi:MAG: type II toxin-antitoxin system RelE/ParE family toxin [Burkholderiales bacterium]|nr:type II toxin-antitoxin system RelE/ParE family toxin [Burkholderiales bacterium]